MEISVSVKDVVEATTQFLSQPSEANMTKLQRNFDAVNGLVSRDSSGTIFKVLNPRGMLGVECLSNLSTLLSSSFRIRSTLSSRLLQFLELLVRDDEIRTALHESFNCLAAISSFLQNHDTGPKDEATVKCVSLLQRITFGVESSNESHQHLEFLVSLLFSLVLGNEEPSLTLSSLALLANLSKNNSFVQSLVKNHVNIKAFYKRLIICLNCKEDTAVIVCAKSIFANLYLNSQGCNDRLGEKFFSQANIRQTFQLVLNCMQKATESTTLLAQSYGADLLLTLLHVPVFVDCLLGYDNRDAFVRGCLDLLVHFQSRRKSLKDGAAFILSKFLQLVSLFTELEELHQILAASINSSVGGEPSYLMTCLLNIVETGPKLMTAGSLKAAEASVDVLERLKKIGAAGTSTLFVSHVIPVCSLVLRALIDQPPISQAPLAPRDSISTGSNVQTSTSTPSDIPSEPLLAVTATIFKLLASLMQFPDAIASFRNRLSFNCPIVIIENLRSQFSASSGQIAFPDARTDVILYSLKFLVVADKMKGIASDEISSQLTSFLEDSQISALIARAVGSKVQDRVQVGLFLLHETMGNSHFSAEQFAATLSSLNATKASDAAVDYPSKRHASMTSLHLSNGNKENVFLTSKSVKQDSLADVDVIIGKLSTEVAEGKDLRTSEILSVYEHKFKSLSMKENHLQDLLDAKALALAQADRLIAQYRCRKAESEAEMTRLRSLLHQSEKEAEKSRDLLNTARLEVDRLQNLNDELKSEKANLEKTEEAFKKLTVERAETVKKLEESVRNNQKLRQENKTLTEMNDMQKKHNESLRATNDNQAEQIAVLDEASRRLKDELDVAVAELTQTKQRAQQRADEGEALEREKLKLEESIDSYRKKLDLLEKANRDQKHQLTSLKVVVEKHEAAIVDKEKTNKELEEKLAQHSAMISMIQNITTGRKN